MSFDSPLFLLFFLSVFGLLRCLPKFGGIILLLASVAFYSVAGLLDMGLVITVVALNYLLSFLVVRDRCWLWVVMLVNLSILIFFKYRHFLIPELAAEVSNFYQGEILIPLGISFYIFQAIAYQVDVAAGRTAHIRSFWHFALFILLFAQVIAGPILRANALEPQVARAFAGRLRGGRRYWSLGLGLCLLGLIKKAGLADSLAPYVDAVFSLGPADSFTAWIGAVLFGFQIYFDFSGYSDIAVGAGYLLGFRLPLNFRQPYLARDPREFWQRWHITLSTWIRDYLYIPLGGGRAGGFWQQSLVVLLTMGLAGLWHGANWTFIFWGLFWGLYLMVWRLLGARLRLPGGFIWILHLIIVTVLWVFFRANNLEQSFDFIGVMFGATGMGNYTVASDFMEKMLIAAGVVLLMCSHWMEAWVMEFRRVVGWRRLDGPVVWGLLVGLILWLVMIPKIQTNPFIYFRF
ncbi:MBOAT family O-acyltransferase [Pseudomonadota bacterium]